MTEEQKRALRRLKQGLEHFDKYDPLMSDDEPIYTAPNSCETIFEFATESGQLTVGHLRDIASLLGDE